MEDKWNELVSLLVCISGSRKWRLTQLAVPYLNILPCKAKLGNKGCHALTRTHMSSQVQKCLSGMFLFLPPVPMPPLFAVWGADGVQTTKEFLF